MSSEDIDRVLPASKKAKEGEWFGVMGIQSHDKAENVQLYVPIQKVTPHHSGRRSAAGCEQVGRAAGTVRQDPDPAVRA